MVSGSKVCVIEMFVIVRWNFASDLQSGPICIWELLKYTLFIVMAPNMLPVCEFVEKFLG